MHELLSVLFIQVQLLSSCFSFWQILTTHFYFLLNPQGEIHYDAHLNPVLS